MGVSIGCKVLKMEDKKLFSRAVNELMDELVHTLHTVVDDLKLKLYNEFTPYEHQSIDCCRTNIDKVKTLFESLKTKSAEVHKKCLKALEELKHNEIAKKLSETMTSVLPKTVNDTSSTAGIKRYNRVFC